MYKVWSKKEFNHFYNMIKLFPHCFDFQKRVEFFYHGLSLNSKSTGQASYVNIRRDRLVEDGMRTFSLLMMQGNLHDRIKVKFVD
jgi:hypothetical protein